MNKINLVGIQLYLILYLLDYHFIPCVIYINGVLCHSLIQTKYGNYLRIYDITINTILIIYVNYYTLWQYYTINITILSLIIFLIKKAIYCQYSYQNQCMHVLGIHIPFGICLYKYLE
jgi:hypothetical protein